MCPLGFWVQSYAETGDSGKRNLSRLVAPPWAFWSLHRNTPTLLYSSVISGEVSGVRLEDTGVRAPGPPAGLESAGQLGWVKLPNGKSIPPAGGWPITDEPFPFLPVASTPVAWTARPAPSPYSPWLSDRNPALAAIALGIMMIGVTGCGPSRTTASPVVQQTSPSSPGVALAANRDAEGLLLSWDPGQAPGSSMVEILDGTSHRFYRLSEQQRRTGRFRYAPVTGQIAASLGSQGDAGAEQATLARVVWKGEPAAGPLQRPVSAPESAGTSTKTFDTPLLPSEARTIRPPAFVLPTFPVQSVPSPPHVAVWQPPPADNELPAEGEPARLPSRGARLGRLAIPR